MRAPRHWLRTVARQLVSWCLARHASLGSAKKRRSGDAPARASPCAEHLGAWLYEESRWAQPGYHVLCVSAPGPGLVDSDRTVELWVGGHWSPGRPVTWRHAAGAGVKELRAQVQRRAGMRKQARWKVLPWALMTPAGEEVVAAEQLGGVHLVFEGGRWVWPGIRENYSRTVLLDVPRHRPANLTLRTLTLDPLAYLVEGFVAARDAKKMIARAKPRFKPAAVLQTDSANAADVAGARTCSEAWVDPKEDGLFGEVAERNAALTRAPRELQADYFRMLEYQAGQHFTAHTDYFEPDDFRQQPQMMEELRDGRNWLVTTYIYLSNVKEGGETYFPSTYGGPLPELNAACEGPSVRPRTGRALMFYSLLANSTPNLSSMHGACKVRRGVKYTANMWTFNQAKSAGKPGEVKRGRGRGAEL